VFQPSAQGTALTDGRTLSKRIRSRFGRNGLSGASVDGAEKQLQDTSFFSLALICYHGSV